MICVCFQRAELYLRFAGIICVFDKGHVAHKGSHDHFNPEVFHVCRMERQPRQFVVPHLSLPMHGRKVVRVTWSEPARRERSLAEYHLRLTQYKRWGSLVFVHHLCVQVQRRNELYPTHPTHSTRKNRGWRIRPSGLRPGKSTRIHWMIFSLKPSYHLPARHVSRHRRSVETRRKTH
jgi:hypothetical protein